MTSKDSAKTAKIHRRFAEFYTKIQALKTPYFQISKGREEWSVEEEWAEFFLTNLEKWHFYAVLTDERAIYMCLFIPGKPTVDREGEITSEVLESMIEESLNEQAI